tara:strand:- start:189 stop:410 length:222 start_codon:yes stop_codon:yes gene_type:complete
VFILGTSRELSGQIFMLMRTERINSCNSDTNVSVNLLLKEEIELHLGFWSRVFKKINRLCLRIYKNEELASGL